MTDPTTRAFSLAAEAIALANQLAAQRDEAVAQRDAANKRIAELTEDEARALRTFRAAADERDALKAKLRETTDLLADAEAKIEQFQAALDTEARR
jgi:septal ring factor EnvC (AmiA/AmiB activator)